MIDSKLSARIEALAPVVLAEAPVPGLAVALVDSAGGTWVGAYGVTDASTGQPVGPRTVFEGASITKPLVALGVLALAREGMLELDRPLGTYLDAPYVPADDRAAAITARMVLGHTTGLPNWRPRGETLALLRDPGGTFGYSGEGFVYLQRVVEQVTGSTLDRWCDERVLGPLGMEESALVWRDEMVARAARGHTESGVPATILEQKPARANAAWSLQTTAPDLALLVGTMLGAPRCGEAAGGRGDAGAVPSETVDAMLRPHVQLHGTLAWGLGWGLLLRADGGVDFWHWGDNYGYKAFAAGSRGRGLGIVVLTNGNAGLAAAERLVGVALPEVEGTFEALRDFGRYLS